jgi:hypothetical protein
MMSDQVLEHLIIRQVVGSFVGIRAASLCSVVTKATGVTQAWFEAIPI